MRNFFSKHKKFIFSFCLIALVSSLGVFIFNINTVAAFSLNPAEIGMSVLNTIMYAIFRFFGLLLSLAGYLLDWAFGLQNFIDVPVVEEGWTITRDLANMFFVLILMVIAIATILKIETYGMKSLLPKLIIIALLINFSLVFCGVVIDSSQILTNFFLEPLTNSGMSLSENVANGLNVVKELENKEVTASLAAADIAIALIGGIIVVLFAAFIMGAAAFFLIIRVVAIWMLLVLVPIALLAITLPATKHLWEKWTKNFIKWVFFAPCYAFFFYLAILTITGKDGQGGFLSKVNSNFTLGENTGWTNTFFSSQELILQYIFLIMLLAGGLVVAQSMSINFAGGTIKLANKIGKGSANWLGRRTQMATAPTVGKLGEKLQKTWVGKTPGVRQAIRPFRTFGQRELGTIAESEKKYGTWTTDNLKSQYNAVDPRSKASISKILAERGDLEKDEKLGFTENDIKKAAKISTRYEQAGAIRKARPDLSPLTGQSIADTIQKTKPADVEKIQADALTSENGEEVIRQIRKQLTDEDGKWRGSHLSKLAETNPNVLVTIRKEVINKGKGSFRKDVEDYLDNDVGKAIFGDKKEKKEPNTIIPPTQEEIRKYG